MKTYSATRRRFVQGLAAGGVLAATPAWLQAAVKGATALGSAPVLSGREIDLVIAETPVNFTGVTRMATTINGSIPAPTLRLREGDDVTIRVTNRLPVDTSIHWHGILLPYQMDGVPGISFKGIAPGETFVYRFKLQQSGTYWYHSHSAFQEMTGMYGALIIEPREEKHRADQDYVVELSDWTDEDPMRALSKLKVQSDVYNFNRSTFFDFTDDVSKMGLQAALEKRQMWNQMRMSPTDLADLSAATFTFLMNGTTPAGNWNGLFQRGDRVRLRFINAAAMTFFDVRIPGLKMTVVAADGQYVQPVSVDEFRIGVAETYDVIVEPSTEQAYTVFAQTIDRTGYARGTLTPNPSLKAEIPEMDSAPILGHSDMGMDMSMMDHSAMGHEGMDHSKMDDSKTGGDLGTKFGSGATGFGSAQSIVHAPTEFGPHVDMRADAAQYLLDDPGIGLRNSSRRVLTYADLRNLNKTPDPRDPEREINLHLTGNMSRYMWSMNGIKFTDAEPLRLKFGERVRINLLNDTMMNHPIHLHGMWTDLETGEGDYIPRKHTVIVQPGARVSYLVTADAMGGWAYHCHLLYHMAGMFRHVIVS